MTEFERTFWQKRLEQCAESLSANNFSVHIAESISHANDIFRKQIFKDLQFKSASWGDSLSLKATGILDFLKSIDELDFFVTFEP